MKCFLMTLALMACLISPISAIAGMKTTRTIPYNNETLSKIDTWAKANDFKEVSKETTNTHKSYKNVVYVIPAPLIIDIDKKDQATATLNVYLKPKAVYRVSAFGMLPSTLPLETNGVPTATPRLYARDSLNKLFNELNLEPIK